MTGALRNRPQETSVTTPHLHHDGMSMQGFIETEGGQLMRVRAARKGTGSRTRTFRSMVVTSATVVDRDIACGRRGGCTHNEPAAEAS